MSDVCPICNGEGKKIHIVKHKQSKAPIACVEWCLCKKSRSVSESPSNPMLSFLGDQYLPIEKIDKQLKFDPEKPKESPFLFIYNTEYNDFCLHLKSIIMKYRFSIPNPLMYCCTSIALLQKFYVKQADDTCEHLSGTDKFDLLVVSLGTREKNNQLNTCISQIIYNRICSAKPLWLYCPLERTGGIGGKADLSAMLSHYEYEYSKDLEDFVWSNFEKIKLRSTGMTPGNKKTKAQDMGANFKRTSIKESKVKK